MRSLDLTNDYTTSPYKLKILKKQGVECVPQFLPHHQWSCVWPQHVYLGHFQSPAHMKAILPLLDSAIYFYIRDNHGLQTLQ